MNREQWLNDAVEMTRPLFSNAGLTLPEVKVSCGWPSKAALSHKKRSIGECWPPEAAKDHVTQVFISPLLDDAEIVLATLVHELLHAAVGCKCGHRGAFKRSMPKIGLTGKATETEADDSLKAAIKVWSEALTAYPNGSLDTLVVEKQKKQGTRLIKCECLECGYLARTTQKWLDAAGAPHCPKHGAMTVEEEKEEEEEDGDE